KADLPITKRHEWGLEVLPPGRLFRHSAVSENTGTPLLLRGRLRGVFKGAAEATWSHLDTGSRGPDRRPVAPALTDPPLAARRARARWEGAEAGVNATQLLPMRSSGTRNRQLSA